MLFKKIKTEPDLQNGKPCIPHLRDRKSFHIIGSIPFKITFTFISIIPIVSS